jgi:hypothetical protein
MAAQAVDIHIMSAAFFMLQKGFFEFVSNYICIEHLEGYYD